MNTTLDVKISELNALPNWRDEIHILQENEEPEIPDYDYLSACNGCSLSECSPDTCPLCD